MTISSRDRRALALLGVAVVLVLLYQAFSTDDATVAPVAQAGGIDKAEKRLLKLRQAVAAVPARESALAGVKSALEGREKGLLRAETAAQAQAQLVQIARRVLRAQQPPVELRSVDPTPPKPFSDDYGEVGATVNFDGRIEQIVNLLADLGSQPELIGVQQMQMSMASGKEKRISVRLVLSALVERKLVPDKPRNSLGVF